MACLLAALNLEHELGTRNSERRTRFLNVRLGAVGGIRSIAVLCSACLVAVEVEAVSIYVLNSELTQTPRLLLQRLNDPRTQGAQFVVRGGDICGKHPVNSRLKWLASPSEEDCRPPARDGADFAPGVEPTNLKAKHIPIMLLSTFHVCDLQLWDWRAKHRRWFALAHNVLLPIDHECLALLHNVVWVEAPFLALGGPPVPRRPTTGSRRVILLALPFGLTAIGTGRWTDRRVLDP
jgi:hypothetical protein